MFSWFGWLLAIALGAGMTLLALQNAQPVSLHAYGYELEGIPLYGVLLMAAVLGAAPLALGGLLQSLRTRLQLRRLRKQLAERDARLSDLEAQVLQHRASG
jgi:uncharacterized integral membrane protein